MAQSALSLPQDISTSAFGSVDFMSSSPATNTGRGLPSSKSMNNVAAPNSSAQSQWVPPPTLPMSAGSSQQGPAPASSMQMPQRSVASLGMGQGFAMPQHLQFPFLTPSPQLMYPPGTSVHPSSAGIPTSGSFFPPVAGAPQSPADWHMAMQAAAMQQQAWAQQQQQQNGAIPMTSPQPYYYGQVMPQQQMQNQPLSMQPQQPQFHSRNTSSASSISFPAQSTISTRERSESSSKSNLETAEYG